MSLAGELVALEKEEATLRGMLREPPSPVSVVRSMTISGPLRPSLKMNLALAGVLGLFVGVLLVFLVHALRAPAEGGRDLPAEESQPIGPTPGQEGRG